MINIAFDAEPQPYFKSLKIGFDFTHYLKILPFGAFKIARNPSELETYIDRYLKDPTLESEQRKELVRQYAGPMDGKSGRRVADFILGLLDE